MRETMKESYEMKRNAREKDGTRRVLRLRLVMASVVAIVAIVKAPDALGLVLGLGAATCITIYALWRRR